MIVIAHRVRPCPHGLGLFTEEPLRQGQLVCNSDDRMIRIVPLAEIETYPAVMQEYFKRYAYRGVGADRLDGAVYHNTDDTRFINHSDTPNLIYDAHQEVYTAACDMAAGTELTCDYADFAQRGEGCFDF